ncbi:MAG: glycosyltransferase family 4 protein [Clostridia bacterium]
MKIGIFTDTYHPDINGVVTSIKMLEKEMISRGHEVHIFTPSKHEPTENQNLYMLKSIPLFVVKNYDYRIAGFYSREIAKQIKELDLDIVHTQSEFSLGHFGKIISRKFDIPFVHTYHTMWEDYVHYIVPIKGTRNVYPKRLARKFSRAFVRKADCIIAPSKKTEKYLKYRCKIKNKNVSIIPTGIDLEPFNPANFTDASKATLKKELGIKETDKVILFVGRLAEEKSVDVIIKGLPEILSKSKGDNIKLVIVGDGPSIEDLKALAKSLNVADNVIFTGRQPWEKIALYYSIGHIFVNASTTETQGLTFIEAMAAKLPVIAKYDTNLDGIIAHNKTGFFFRKDEEYPKLALKILADEKLRQKVQANGFEHAKQFSVKYFGDALEIAYAGAIKHHVEDKEKKAKKRLANFAKRKKNESEK